MVRNPANRNCNQIPCTSYWQN